VTPCPRFPSKIQHPTREEALDHQKRLVFKDVSTGRADRAKGLHVYPCEACGCWHVGHVESLPLVWHYTTCSELDAILETGALEPSNPRAFIREKNLSEDEIEDYLEGSLDIAAIPLSRSFQNRYRRGYPKWVDVPVPNSRRRVKIPRDMIERDRLLWFSRNEYWEHSIDDPDRQTLEVGGEGLLRFGVPPSVAKLRWSDYVARNQTHPSLQRLIAVRADPTEWLATDEPVPLDKVQLTQVYFRGVWTSIEQVDDGDFERYLAEREAVYDEARKTMGRKLDAMKQAGWVDAPAKSGSNHGEILQYLESTAAQLKLTPDERFVFEDFFYMYVQLKSRGEVD